MKSSIFRQGSPALLRRLRLFFIFAATMAILTVATCVGLLTGYIHTLPPIERLEDYSPAQVSVVYDRDGNHIAQFSSERRQVTPIHQIPINLKRSFLAIEDARFYEHFGIDLKSMARSVVVNRRAGRIVQGGSTITMQLPRNIISEKVGREKTIDRKIREVLLSLQIERRYSKDQILEFYLNQIFLGHNSYGVRAAAETYFNKTPKQLSLAECATLAGIPKGPSVYNPITDPQRARQRRDLVLGRMRDLGWIADSDYKKAVASELAVTPAPKRSNVLQSEFPYFVDALNRELKRDYDLSGGELRSGGLRIYSTLQSEIQRIAEEELRAGLVRNERKWEENKSRRFDSDRRRLGRAPEPGQVRLAEITYLAPLEADVRLGEYRATLALPATLPYYEPASVLEVGKLLDVRIKTIDRDKRTFTCSLADEARMQGSVVILDARDGSVLAIVGGADFRDSANAGQYNRAILGGRPTGSAIKPFFYATALEMGFGPHDQIVDEPIVYPSAPADYIPRNFERKFFGPTTLIEGLEHSRNIVTVRMFEALGIRKTLKQVVQFDPSRGDAKWRKKFRVELPVCLGSVDMTAMELATAYLALANNGVEKAAPLFKSIRDGRGQTTHSPLAAESIILDPVSAAQTTYMMRQVVESGSAYRTIGREFPQPRYPQIAGKTGTTNRNAEAWFVGFTPELIMVCYVGFDKPRPMGSGMTGSRVAAPIWANIFRRVLETRDNWKMEFDLPIGVETYDICAVTGKGKASLCEIVGHKIYKGVPYAISDPPRGECDLTPREPIIAPASMDQGWAQPNFDINVR